MGVTHRHRVVLCFNRCMLQRPDSRHESQQPRLLPWRWRLPCRAVPRVPKSGHQRILCGRIRPEDARISLYRSSRRDPDWDAGRGAKGDEPQGAVRHSLGQSRQVLPRCTLLILPNWSPSYDSTPASTKKSLFEYTVVAPRHFEPLPRALFVYFDRCFSRFHITTALGIRWNTVCKGKSEKNNCSARIFGFKCGVGLGSDLP